MDLALLKKMNVYAPERDIAGTVPDEKSPVSTLIKADISLFHQMPKKLEMNAAVSSAPVVNDVQALDEEAPREKPEAIESESVPVKTDYQSGFDDGKAKSDTVHSGTVKVLQKAVNAMQADVKKTAQSIEQSHLSVVASCLRAIFPDLIRRETEVQLMAVLKQACSVSDAGAVTLYVHPDDVEMTKTMCSEKSLSVSITGDPGLEPGQTRAIWGEGGADIDCKKIADDFMRRLEQTLPDLTDAQPLETSDD